MFLIYFVFLDQFYIRPVQVSSKFQTNISDCPSRFYPAIDRKSASNTSVFLNSLKFRHYCAEYELRGAARRSQKLGITRHEKNVGDLLGNKQASPNTGTKRYRFSVSQAEINPHQRQFGWRAPLMRGRSGGRAQPARSVTRSDRGS